MDPSPGQIEFIRDITNPQPPAWPHHVIAKVMRGAGKTKCCGVSFAWIHRTDPTKRIFVQSGSFLQARRLYSYYLPLIQNPELFPQDWLVGEPTQSLTLFKQGGGLEILAASAKRSRGGHVDVLCIDEAVLVKPDLIDAVWPVVRTSKTPKRIVVSTPSPEVNLEWFLRVWDDADRLGFKRHEWPLEECHWINKADTEQARLMLDSQTFAIEYLGEKGERKGRVWDTELIIQACVDPRRAELYPLEQPEPLTEKAVGLDWGFIHPTVFTAWEKQGETVYARDCRIRPETALTEIMQELREDFAKAPIYADSSGTHENDQLRRLGLNVIPVVFSRDKDELIGHVRWRLERGSIKIPDPKIDSRFFTLVEQMKAYNYDEHGKPRKVNDDAVDSMLCAMKRWLTPPRKPGAAIFEPPSTYQDYRRESDRDRFLRGRGS